MCLAGMLNDCVYLNALMFMMTLFMYFITGSVKIEYFFGMFCRTHIFGKLVGRVPIATNNDLP